MSTVKRKRFVSGVSGWMLAAILLLTLLGTVEYELFFVISLIGFLIIVELTAPINVTPRWRKRLMVILVLGLAVFGTIVFRRILEHL